MKADFMSCLGDNVLCIVSCTVYKGSSDTCFCSEQDKTSRPQVYLNVVSALSPFTKLLLENLII